jgi:putative ABC transport system permease protein
MRTLELLRLALGGVRRTPLRVALTSAGVAIATGALVSMIGFAFGMQEQVEEPFQRSELANRIDVSAPTADLKSGQAAPLLDDDAVARIGAVAGVVLAYPELSVNGEVNHGGKTQSVTATGLPREAGRLRLVRDCLVAGRFFSPGGGPDVILGQRLVRLLGFGSPEEAVGAAVRITTRGLTPDGAKSFRYEDRAFEARVVGVWDPPGGPSGHRPEGVLLPLDVIRDLPGAQAESVLDRLRRGLADAPPGYGRVVVRVGRPADLFRAEEGIRTLGFRTHTLLTQIREMRKAFVLMDLVLGAVGTVALVVAGLGIINTMLMAVLERVREIGVYKALGASDGDIRVLFLAEAAVVGLLGGLAGLALGRVVSWGIDVVVNELARRQGIDDRVVFFSFPPYLLGGAMLFAVAVSLVSGVYPAGRAARVDPVRALRAE